jgi:dinuclear metal center YbgI/SA1388 family protein
MIMTTVGALYDAINAFAPFAAAKASDNCGILVGSRDQSVSRVMVVVDVTRAIVEEAAEKGVDCILAHHPLIYNPMRAIGAADPVYAAIRNGITILAAHTNLDVAEGGVNDTYLQAIGLKKIGTVDGTDGCCALAAVPEELADVRVLAEHIRAAVGLPAVKFVDSGRKIKTAAVCCGGGASFFEAAVLSGADVFVSGDFRHNHAADALRARISLVDAGHYETEALVRDRVIARLAAALPEVRFLRAESDQPIFQYQVMPSC